MATRNGNTGVRVLLCALLMAGATGASAQAWGGVEQFNTLNTLPVGWEKSPSGVGAASPNNLWNVDANPTNLPPPYPATSSISPAFSGQYSLNWNDGADANPGTGQAWSPPVEGGVLTPIVDITFAPNPRLEFRENWHRDQAHSSQHVMHVRFWDETLTTKFHEELMPQGVGVLGWQARSFSLSSSWGRVRVEFCYICGPNYTFEEQSAGWFIDDVDFTGLNPPMLGISNASTLPAQTAGANFQVQLNALNGTPPYTFSFVPQSPVPPGLTVNAGGLLAGPVSESGIYRFAVRVADSSTPTLTADKFFRMTVNRAASFAFSAAPLPFIDDFSTDKGWVFTDNNPPAYAMSTSSPPTPYSNVSNGMWQRGTTFQNTPPNNNCGGDPASDHTATSDNMLLGVNLGGTIPVSAATPTPRYWAYSPEIEIGGKQELTIKFWRWVNVGNAQYHQVSAEMWRPQTSSWIPVWTLPPTQPKATQWTPETIQINLQSAPAANATTRIRFGWIAASPLAYQPSTWLASGANIDDLEVIAKPVPGVLKVSTFVIDSPTQIGSPPNTSPRTFVGNDYPLVLALENTSSFDIAVHSASFTFDGLNGTTNAWLQVNVGQMVAVPGPAPSPATPWIIPPGVHYVSYNPASPPGGAGPEIGHIDFQCTSVVPAQFTGAVVVDIVLYGTELGGPTRSTITDGRNDQPSMREFFDVQPMPPLVIVDPVTLPAATINVPYTYAFTAQHGAPPYVSWQASAVAVVPPPPALVMNHNVLQFTPTTASFPAQPVNFDVTVQVTDSAMATAVVVFTIPINSPAAGLQPLQVTTPSQLPSAVELTPYGAVSFNAIGGTPPYSWGNLNWILPPAASGPLSGMGFIPPSMFGGQPAAGTAGTYAFTLTCTDSTVPPLSTTATFYVNVSPANTAVVIVTPTMPGALGAPPVGLETAPYNSGQPFQFSATGGYVGPPGQEYLWSVVQGQLPAGLSLNPSTGELSGTPSGGGTYQFTLRASDGAFPPATGDSQFEITIDPLIPTPLQISNGANLPPGSEGNPYRQLLTAQYGKTPYTWQIKQGSALPAGLAIDQQTGEIVGVIDIGQASPPTQDFVFTVEVLDGSVVPEVAEKAFTLNIAAFVPGPLTITNNADLPQAGAFSPYSVRIYATGGSPVDPQNPYFFSVKLGSSLPAGLILEADGRLHGTPGTQGSHTFTIEAFDGAGSTVSKEFTLQINGLSEGGGATIKRGKQTVELVPFWEACSVGPGGSSSGLLLIAALTAMTLVARRRKA